MCKYCEKTKIGYKDVFDGYSRKGRPKYKKVDNIDISPLEIRTAITENIHSSMYIDIDTNTLTMHHAGDAYSYAFDVETDINYCPICGRKLK